MLYRTVVIFNSLLRLNVTKLLMRLKPGTYPCFAIPSDSETVPSARIPVQDVRIRQASQADLREVVEGDGSVQLHQGDVVDQRVCRLVAFREK